MAPLVALPAERAGRLLALLNHRMPPLGLDPDIVAFLSDPDGDPGGGSSCPPARKHARGGSLEGSSRM